MLAGTDVVTDVIAAFRRVDVNGRGSMDCRVVGHLLRGLNASAWSDGKIEALFATYGKEPCNGDIQYVEFLKWLFDDKAAFVGCTSLPVTGMEFTLMTFNVEEYWHGYNSKVSISQLGGALGQGKMTENDVRSWFKNLKAHVFKNIAAIRRIVEAQNPDVLCLEEHSLGLDIKLLKRMKLDRFLGDDCGFYHEDILEALIPDSYGVFVKGTGECPAKFSELGNVVAWKKSRFEVADQKAKVGAQLTHRGKRSPGGDCYTPRSAACVELRLGGEARDRTVIVCATHLMGGRYEDKNWAVDREAGANERVDQVVAIQAAMNSNVFTPSAPCVIAGDFNAMRKGFISGSFAEGARQYVFGGTMLYSKRQLESEYLENYVPYQTAVHSKLEDMGYVAAYGRNDDDAQMKTSLLGGCVDWIYVKGLQSKKDERVIPPKLSDELGLRDVTDHYAVVVTLSFV